MQTNGISKAHTPSLQDMVKAAQAGTLSRTRVAAEAQRQLDNLGGEKTASEHCSKCSHEPCECPKEKKSSVKVSTAYATKAAEALTYLAGEIKKEAATVAPPPKLTEHTSEPGTGPGAQEVNLHGTKGHEIVHQGHGHETVPEHPKQEKVLKTEHGETQMATNYDHRAGGSGTQPLQTVPKHAAAQVYARNLEVMFGKQAATTILSKQAAAADLYRKNCAAMGVKVAEDAIFPARIDAGKAVPPEASAGGEPGGAPAGGMPQGRKGTDSNQSSIDITKGQAKSDPKSDLKKWFNEPALSSSTDTTLSQAFDATSRAGTKYGSAGTAEKEGDADSRVKTASARALLENLLEQVKSDKAA